MGKIHNKFLIVACSFFTINPGYAQEEKAKRGLSLQVQSSAFFVSYQDFPSSRNSDYEIGNNSRIYGAEATVLYNFKSIVGIGLGGGFERLTLQNEMIDYYPLYVNITPFPIGNPKKGFASFDLRIGVHKGNLDKDGFFYRGALGYHIPIINHLSLFIKGRYIYHKLYKTFENSGRPTNYYSFRGFGFGFGIEIY